MNDTIKIAYTTFICPKNYILEFRASLSKDIISKKYDIKVSSGIGSKDWWICWNGIDWHHRTHGYSK